MGRARIMPRILMALVACMTLVGVTARTVAMLTVFDASVGYLDPGLLPTISRAMYFAIPVVALLCVCIIPKGALPATLVIPGRKPLALLCGAALALTSLLIYILVPTRGALVTLLVVFGLVGSTYFFVSATRQGRYPDWLGALGFPPIAWCLVGIAQTYTDQFTTMNSPIKVSLQMGLIGFMLLLIAELRPRLGKEPAPRAAALLMSIGSYMALSASLPLTVAAIAGKTAVQRALTRDPLHPLYATVLLSAGLYGLYMLIRFTCAPGELPAEEESVEEETVEDELAEDESVEDESVERDETIAEVDTEENDESAEEVTEEAEMATEEAEATVEETEAAAKEIAVTVEDAPAADNATEETPTDTPTENPDC